MVGDLGFMGGVFGLGVDEIGKSVIREQELRAVELT